MANIVNKSLRVPMIILLVAGLFGCLGGVAAAGYALWQYLQPDSKDPFIDVQILTLPKQFIPILIYFGLLAVILMVVSLPARLLWGALENLVERFWQDDWDRWQQVKAKMRDGT